MTKMVACWRPGRGWLIGGYHNPTKYYKIYYNPAQSSKIQQNVTKSDKILQNPTEYCKTHYNQVKLYIIQQNRLLLYNLHRERCKRGQRYYFYQETDHHLLDIIQRDQIKKRSKGMKIRIYRLERNRFGFPYYREIALVDYSEDHEWTEVERRIMDRVIIEQDEISLEWDCLLDYARLNRIFIDWGKVSTYFYVKGDKYILDKMLRISRGIFDKLEVLDPFKLMVISAGCKKIPDHLRKTIRQAIYDVINKVFESHDQEQEQSQDQEQDQDQEQNQDKGQEQDQKSYTDQKG
jgi:hypothetical protein